MMFHHGNIMVGTVVIHGRSSWKSTPRMGKSIQVKPCIWLMVVYHQLWWALRGWFIESSIRGPWTSEMWVYTIIRRWQHDHQALTTALVGVCPICPLFAGTLYPHFNHSEVGFIVLCCELLGNHQLLVIKNTCSPVGKPAWDGNGLISARVLSHQQLEGKRLIGIYWPHW